MVIPGRRLRSSRNSATVPSFLSMVTGFFSSVCASQAAKVNKQLINKVSLTSLFYTDFKMGFVHFMYPVTRYQRQFIQHRLQRLIIETRGNGGRFHLRGICGGKPYTDPVIIADII